MLTKRGFGESSFEKSKDLKVVINLIQEGKIAEAEVILLSLNARKKLNHVGFHLLATVYKFKSEHLIALKLLNNQYDSNQYESTQNKT